MQSSLRPPFWRQHCERLNRLICLILLMLAQSASAFELDELAPGLYLHRGAIADIDSPLREDSANIGFIVGERCVAVVDTGGSSRTGRALLAAIRAQTPLPVCYVINTHVHFDHLLGNGVFRATGAQFVGHAQLSSAIADSRDFFLERFADEVADLPLSERIVAPDMPVTDQLELDLGGRTLTVRAVQTAHTHTDLTVYDAASDTLWTGDLLFRERMPILNGSLKGWLRWLEEAEQHNYRLVIPGHGPPDRVWPEGARAEREYFQTLIAETRAALAKGLFLEDAQGVVAEGEKGKWQLSDRAHGLNVSRTYRELEWE